MLGYSSSFFEILSADVIDNALLTFLNSSVLWQLVQTGTEPEFSGYKNLIMQSYREENHEKQQQILTALYLQQTVLQLAKTEKTVELLKDFKNFLISYSQYPLVIIENRLLALSLAIIYSSQSPIPDKVLLNGFSVYVELVKIIKPELVNSILAEIAHIQHDEKKFKEYQTHFKIDKLFSQGYTQYNRNEMALILKPFLFKYREQDFSNLMQLTKNIAMHGVVEIASQWNIFEILQVLIKILPNSPNNEATFLYILDELKNKLYEETSLDDDIITTIAVCINRLSEQDMRRIINQYFERIKYSKNSREIVLVINILAKIGEKTTHANAKQMCLTQLQKLLEQRISLHTTIVALSSILRNTDSVTSWNGFITLFPYLYHNSSVIVTETLEAIKVLSPNISKIKNLEVLKVLFEFLNHKHISIIIKVLNLIAEIVYSFHEELRTTSLFRLLPYLENNSLRFDTLIIIVKLWLTLPELNLKEKIFPLLEEYLQQDIYFDRTIELINQLISLLTFEDSCNFLKRIFSLPDIKIKIADDQLLNLIGNLFIKMPNTRYCQHQFSIFKNLLLNREEPLYADYNIIMTQILSNPLFYTERQAFLEELFFLLRSTEIQMQLIAIPCITKLILLPGLHEQRDQFLNALRPLLKHTDVNKFIQKAAVLATADLLAGLPKRTLDSTVHLSEIYATYFAKGRSNTSTNSDIIKSQHIIPDCNDKENQLEFKR